MTFRLARTSISALTEYNYATINWSGSQDVLEGFKHTRLNERGGNVLTIKALNQTLNLGGLYDLLNSLMTQPT